MPRRYRADGTRLWNSYFLKCAAQLPMDNVIHKFIEGILILESLHAHIFNAFLFVNTDRENAEWDTLKIC